MPINIDKVYKEVQDILSKNQQGYISPSEFNRYANMASFNLFNRYYGSVKQYRPEKPVARINYASTQQISEALKPFLEEQVPVAVTVGSASTPDDKIHTVAIRHNYVDSGANKTASFRRVEWDRLDSWLNSSIDAPTKEFPIYVEGSDTLNIFPSTITNILITYLRVPADAVWGYTLSGNRPIYDAGSSTNFEWSEEEANNIVMEIVSLASASLKDNESLAYAESTKRGDA